MSYSDGLNELGKYLEEIDSETDHRLNRYSKNKIKLEKERDIFDKRVPFTTYFYTEENEKTINLDLLLRPPPPSGCCGDCFCTIWEVYTDGVDELTTLYEYIPGSVKAFLNGDLVTTFIETGPMTILFTGTFDEGDELKINYVYETGNDCTTEPYDVIEEVCTGSTVRDSFWNSSNITASSNGPWVSTTDIWNTGDWHTDSPTSPFGTGSSTFLTLSSGTIESYGQITQVGPAAFGVKKNYSASAPWNMNVVTGRFKFRLTNMTIPTTTGKSVKFTYGAAALKLNISSVGGSMQLITSLGTTTIAKTDWQVDTNYIAEIKLNLLNHTAVGNFYLSSVPDVIQDTVSGTTAANEQVGLGYSYAPWMGMFLESDNSTPWTVRLYYQENLSWHDSSATMETFNRIVSPSEYGWGGGWVTKDGQVPQNTPGIQWSVDGTGGIMTVTNGAATDGSGSFYELPDGPVDVRFSISDYATPSSSLLFMSFKQIPANSPSTGVSHRLTVDINENNTVITAGDTVRSQSTTINTTLFTGSPVNVHYQAKFSGAAIKLWPSGEDEPLEWTITVNAETKMEYISWFITDDTSESTTTFKIGPVITSAGTETGVAIVAPGPNASGLHGSGYLDISPQDEERENSIFSVAAPNLTLHGTSNGNGRLKNWATADPNDGNTYPFSWSDGSYSIDESGNANQFGDMVFGVFGGYGPGVLRSINQGLGSWVIDPDALAYFGRKTVAGLNVRMRGNLYGSVGGSKQPEQNNDATWLVAIKAYGYADATINTAQDVFYYDYTALGFDMHYQQMSFQIGHQFESYPYDIILTSDDSYGLSVGTNGVSYLQYSVEIRNLLQAMQDWGPVDGAFLFPPVAGYEASVNNRRWELFDPAFGAVVFHDDPCPPNTLTPPVEETPDETPA